MTPSVRVSLLAALIALLPALPSAQVAPSAPGAGSPRTVRVSGEGRVNVRPDVAILFAGVEATGPDLAKLGRESAERLRKILAALGEAGIAQKDVQTLRHDVQVERPFRDGKPGPITGYTISDELRITVRDLDRLGSVIDRVTAAGANAIRSLSLQKDDTGPERAQALATAYAAARAKAESLARAAGVSLGDVLSMSESTQPPIYPMRSLAMARASSKEATPIAAGEVEITSSVEVVFAIR